jgi:HrpA-like RNA helicase
VLDGEVFRLYTADEHASQMREHTAPEITRVPLDAFLLSAKAAGIDDLETFEWPGKSDPDASKAELERALWALPKKGATDVHGDCTHRGIELAGYEVASLDQALCMSESDTFGCSLEMATFLAFVDCRENLFASGQIGVLAQLRWSRVCFDDLNYYFRLFHHWSRLRPESRQAWCEETGLRSRALLEVDAARNDLLRSLSHRTHDRVTWRELDLARLDRVRLVLARSLREPLERLHDHLAHPGPDGQGEAPRELHHPERAAQGLADEARAGVGLVRRAAYRDS